MNTVAVGRVLIAEDEERIATLLVDYLVREGFSCTHIADGAAVVDAIRRAPPALVLLDVMLPGRDGLSVCRDIRAFSRVPIIMLTARVEEIDRLLGFELGADDYICKPFSPREVVARVRAVLRRGRPAADEAPMGTLALDRSALRVRAFDREVSLTTVEFELLAALFGTPGRIFTRAELMDRIYTDHRVVFDRTVDSHVKKLRKKLAAVMPEHELIVSIYGAGYRYEPPG